MCRRHGVVRFNYYTLEVSSHWLRAGPVVCSAPGMVGLPDSGLVLAGCRYSDFGTKLMPFASGGSTNFPSSPDAAVRR